MKDIKAIICDLDGTLLNDAKEVSEENIKAIRACRKKGMLFGIASGRPVEPILELMKEWGIQNDVDFVLGMNGGVIYDCHTQMKDEYHVMDGAILKEIMQHYEGMQVRFLIYDGAIRYVNISNEKTLKNADLFKEIEVKTDLFKLCEKPHHKIIVQCDADYMPLVEEHGKRYVNDACVSFKTAPDLYEFVDPRVNKSFGLQRVCEKLGFTMDHVCAFGDTSNDLEMIRDAGIGVWMKNGTSDVKAVCDVIAKSNEDHGVAAYLCEKFLNHA